MYKQDRNYKNNWFVLYLADGVIVPFLTVSVYIVVWSQRMFFRKVPPAHPSPTREQSQKFWPTCNFKLSLTYLWTGRHNAVSSAGRVAEDGGHTVREDAAPFLRPDPAEVEIHRVA